MINQTNKMHSMSGQSVIEYMVLFALLFFSTLAFWKQTMPAVVAELRNEQGLMVRCMTDYTKSCK